MSETNPFKTYRDDKGLTQAELGELLGVDSNTVARWERGEHLPQKQYWAKIAERTGILPAELAAAVKQDEALQ